jgi:hypothetical protein
LIKRANKIYTAVAGAIEIDINRLGSGNTATVAIKCIGYEVSVAAKTGVRNFSACIMTGFCLVWIDQYENTEDCD